MKFKIALRLVFLATFISSSKARRKPDNHSAATDRVYLYRLLNWCIIGRGEYKINDWPYSQFKPLLHLSYKNEFEEELNKVYRKNLMEATDNKDPWNVYDLQFSPITCAKLDSAKSGLGHNNAFLQRLHIRFVPKSGVLPFQGLLIQAVHAPFGLGFPFGVFDTDQEFNCSDCKFFRFSDTIGCISRPELSTMHPNVAVFHFKARGTEPTERPVPNAPPAPTTDPPEEEEHGFRSELHWNFKWANIPCSSSRIVEFWVLMVVDFDRRIWTVKKFGPYDLNDIEAVTSSLEKPKTDTVIPGVPPPAPPTPPGKPTPAPFPPPSKINFTRSGFPTPIIPECDPFEENPLDYNGTGRPYSCFRQYTSYDPKKCARWHKLQRRKLKPGSSIICEGPAVSPKILADKTRIRFVGDFDVSCIRKFPGALYEKITSKSKRQPHKICPEWQGRYRCEGKDDDLWLDSTIHKKGDGSKTRPFPGSHCKPCVPVTEPATTEPYDWIIIIRRDWHGSFMIYAFFFFNPVSLNTARFYKETFHERQFKGWRPWLIIHVVFAVLTAIFAYVGYTLAYYDKVDLHIGLGFGAVIGVCTGVLTGWLRHKNRVPQIIMFILHAWSGYGGWGLAIACFAVVPDTLVSIWAKIVSYIASGFCLFAMVVMTVNICSVDAKLGVRPRRQHLPIIEIRFDDIVPPGGLCRKVFFYIYIVVQFIICAGMMCL